MVGEAASSITAWAVFSAIGGSLVGSIIGGVVNYFLQRKALKAAQTQRDDDRDEKRKAVGYALIFKMIRIASNLHNLGTALKNCFKQAEEQGFKGAPWQIVQPIIPANDPIHFSPEEMALLLSIDDKLFNEMASLDQLHNSTSAIFDLYGSMREKVMEKFGATMSGNIGTTGLTQEQANWLAPRALQLNRLIEAMQHRSEQDGKEAWMALERLRDTLEAKLGIKHRLERRPT